MQIVDVLPESALTHHSDILIAFDPYFFRILTLMGQSECHKSQVRTLHAHALLQPSMRIEVLQSIHSSRKMYQLVVDCIDKSAS